MKEKKNSKQNEGIKDMRWLWGLEQFIGRVKTERVMGYADKNKRQVKVGVPRKDKV